MTAGGRSCVPITQSKRANTTQPPTRRLCITDGELCLLTTKQERPTVPDREALRALYDAAAEEINTTRSNKLSTGFYNKTKDAVFNAGYAALSDFHTDTRRMHTVSAPVGGGKTSFSYAFIAAVTRCAEQNVNAAYGCAFVTDQIERADEVYRELEALLPGKVAIWTTDHDCNCTKPTKLENPAARFDRDALQHYPVAVVTHQSYLGPKGYKTSDWWSRVTSRASWPTWARSSQERRSAALLQAPAMARSGPRGSLRY